MSPGHYFDADPAVPSRPGQVELSLPDLRVTLQTDRGVFSYTAVDAGTLQLLRAIPAPPSAGDLLDLGCGYGPIACALAHRAPGAVVWAVDVNARARELAEANAAALGQRNVRVVEPDGIPAAISFDGIWSNPPVRVGKAVLHDLLLQWLPRLRPGAAAWLVVQRHLGADSLADWLASEQWPTTRVASKKGYRILRVMRP
jgi:16S rRNA (guanine1207-N2)-methyltransferase